MRLRLRRTRSRSGNGAFRQSPFQLPKLLETLCHITYDRKDRDHYARCVPQRHNRKFNRDGRSGLVQRRYREDVALAVPAVSRGYRAAIPLPMPTPQTLRNDEVEGLTDRISGGMTENPFGARIPKTNNALAVCGNDRVGARV